MEDYMALSSDQLRVVYDSLKQEYEEFQARNLKLDMSRGKPGADQLELSQGLVTDTATHTPSGLDCRNYGGIEGFPEIRQLFAEMMEVPAENVVVGNNSSLNMMFDKIASAMTHGICGGKPWMLQGGVKFLCPAPGYDRHFGICEYFGIDMITVPMTPEGPNMAMVEELVSSDEKIKGMWCVPKYSNPQGITYSDETVRRIANLKPAAKDFRVFWDNAYCVHDLTDTPDHLLPFYAECVKAGNEDMPILFASTSKISLPGSGVAAMAASANNLKQDKKRISMQTVGPDKMNMIRHLDYFKNMDGIHAQMKRHAEKIAPKFNIVCDKLQEQFGENKILFWRKPNGGYFVSVDTLEGCAKRVVELCAQAGVKLTGAGATYPYGKDPHDTNIRLAPTFPTLEELSLAMDLFCLCVKIASIEKMLAE